MLQMVFFIILQLFASYAALAGNITLFLYVQTAIVSLLILAYLINRRAWNSFTNWIYFGAKVQGKYQKSLYGKWLNASEYILRLIRTQEKIQIRRTERMNLLISAIQASPNGFILLDRDKRIEWMNVKAAEYLALDPVNDRLQYIKNLIRLPEFVKYIDDVDYHKSLAFSRDPLTKLSLRCYPYGGGKFLMLVVDITQETRLEKMRQDFVANVSHEIRTPLTIVAGFIETMQDLKLSEEEKTRYLALMYEQTERMQVLVNDLLKLTSIEDGDIPPLDAWNTLTNITDHVQQTMFKLSNNKHKIFLLEGPNVQLAGIKSELVSAIENICVNAIQYTPIGGEITLSWELDADSGLIIAVKDTGEGIEAKHLPRLTERFYRADSSRMRNTGGTGLGLAIVKHVLLRHGGYIDIESEIGVGTTVRLHFPAKRVQLIAEQVVAEQD